MFPQIVKSKKKPKIGTDEMIKECQQTMKELQFKHKKALKLLPQQLVSDFHKVCRLKDINAFYPQYFFFFIQKAPISSLQQHFAQEVENIMLGRSYYQKIQILLKERGVVLNEIKQQLNVVQGFNIMNSGKNLPIGLKGLINELIKDCKSLEQVKTIQISQVTKLADGIGKMRENLKEVVEIVISWEYKLRSLCGQTQPASFKKMKVIYPQHGINCFFGALYDCQIIRSSFLNQQIKFLNVQFDPFLLYIESLKKTSRIFQQQFMEPLRQKGLNYKKIESYIFDSIPKKQSKEVQFQQKQKDMQGQRYLKKERQRGLKRTAKSQRKLFSPQKSQERPHSNQRKRSENKKMNDFLQLKLINENNETKDKTILNSKTQINIDKIFDVYKKNKKTKPESIYKEDNGNIVQRKSLNRSKSRSIQSVEEKAASPVKSIHLLEERELTISSNDNRSRRSAGSIDQSKSMSKTLTNMKKNEKIQNIYKLSSNNQNQSIANKLSPASKVKNVSKPSITDGNVEKILQEKQELIKELQKQKKEQEALRKIIKRVQTRTQSENKTYDKKMEMYEKEIILLKGRIKEREKRFDKEESYVVAKEEKNKNNNSVVKIYQKKIRNSTNQLNSSENDHKIVNEPEYAKSIRASPQLNIAQSRLIQQKNSNKMLQSKIKQLTKQKINLQKLIEKEGSKVNKEKQIYQRKLQKYVQVINKLKNESAEMRNGMVDFRKKYSQPDLDKSNVENYRINEHNQESRQDKLMKLYTKRHSSGLQKEKVNIEMSQMVSPSKKKKNSKVKVQKKQNTQKSIERSRQKSIQQIFSQRKVAQVFQKKQQDLKITNNRNTIEIVYKPNKKSKKKLKDFIEDESTVNQTVSKQKSQQLQKHLYRLQKEKSLLQRKLDLKMNEKSGAQIHLMKKLQQSQHQLQKYKQQIQKQKSTNIRYDQRIKQLRKKINQEYEQKMQHERQRYEQQKQHLFYKLKEERESKIQKDKYLSRQMIFLKEMQMRENQLVSMLQTQRKEREERERMLEEDLMKKQEVLQEYELEEIKRVIERQVREEMRLVHQEEEDRDNFHIEQKNSHDFSLKKQQIQNEIRDMLEENDYELQEIDEENEKLKELIEKIKEEEQKVILNLQTDIASNDNEEDEEMKELHLDKIINGEERLKTEDQYNKSRTNFQNQSELDDLRGQVSLQQSHFNPNFEATSPQKNKRLLFQLQQKSELQLQNERLSHSRYQELQQSPNYKERQKLENIIEHYLRNPHSYPENRSIVLKPQEQVKLIEDLTFKSKKAKQFQQELMELKNIQSFVPAQRDDPISSHMLSLREAYENQEAEALRRVLFPALMERQNADEYENMHELSFESSEAPPPITLLDHVKVHQQKYLEQKGHGNKPTTNKNFMAINRMKLLQIEQEKKQKQRQLIEEEAKKKVRKIKLKAKKKEEQQLKQFIEIKQELQAKEKKREVELQKAKKGKHNQEKEEEKNLKKEQIHSKKEKLKENEKNQNLDGMSSSQQKQNNEFLEPKKNSTQKLELIKKSSKIEQEDKDIKSTVIGQKTQQKFPNTGVKNEHTKIQSQKATQQITDKIAQKMQCVELSIQKKHEQKGFQMIGQDGQDEQNLNGKEVQKQTQKDNLKEEQYDDEQFQDQIQGFENEFIAQTKKKQENEALKQLKYKLANELEPKNYLEENQKEQKTQNYNKQCLQEKGQQHEENSNNNQDTPKLQEITSQNLALMLLEHQRSSLKQDLLSYQQEIRSYISSYSQFEVYQHFVLEKQLNQYMSQVLELSSEEIKKLNNNPTLKNDALEAECLLILVAKDKKTKLQLGIGVFHKEFQHSEYICGYMLAHDMLNFLNLTFNFSRYIYQHDSFCHSVEFIFTVSALEQQQNKTHFEDFQNKCKRLGQIYVKGKQSQTRKYVLKRNLFEFIDNQEALNEDKGILFETKVQVHENLMKEKNQGFKNEVDENFCSPTILLSFYLKNNTAELQIFRNLAENDLKNRQILITALVFSKKQFTLKNIQSKIYDTQKKFQIYKNILGNALQIDDLHQKVEEMSFSLSQIPPKHFKRCLLQMQQNSIPYFFLSCQEALNRVQTNNSSQIGTFIPLIPRFKVLIIPAGEFLTSCSSNPDMNIFFYTKHFIKNITEVKKESVTRVFLPEIKYENWIHFKGISEKLKKTVFEKEKIQLGFQSKINNSVIFTPSHNDLVIEKPFIISVMSANIERTIEGSPIFCKLIK